MDGRWKSFLKREWPAGTSKKILKALSELDGVRAQEREKQSEFKASFYVKPSRKNEVLAAVRKILSEKSVKNTIVVSKGRQRALLLDILPPNASKEKAVRILAKRCNVGYSNIVFAGDSGNDYSLLASNLKAIVVNNAESELKKMVLKKARRKATQHLVYFAEGKFDCDNGEDVCGVLEGALHYKIFSSRKEGVRIQMLSIHGLVDKNFSDLGRDADTGGQVVYVVELAKALGKLQGVGGVDLFTRRIEDEQYPHYSKKVEYLNEKARIVRIRCGGRKYLKKTKLWPFLDEYVENVLKFNEEDGVQPDVIHANYADAGLACTKLADETEAVLVFTAHSLGIPKMQKLGVNKKNFREFNNKEFHFTERLKAEQKALDTAVAVIVSTNEEKEEQYKGYDVDNRKFHVIPPGVDLSKFHPSRKPETAQQELFKIISKGLANPRKPIVLAVSRLDKRKNLPALARAFCKSKILPRMANLVILTGLKKNADKEQKAIYRELRQIALKTKNQHNVSLVKFVEFKEGLGALYRVAARSKGVFVNPALIEPFGLTILEASACGMPVIATKYGGPREIINHGTNGLFIDPRNEKEMEKTIVRVLKNQTLWKKLSKNAVKNVSKYSWDATARKEFELFKVLLQHNQHEKMSLALKRVFKARA